MKPHVGSEANLLSSFSREEWNDVKYIWNNSYIWTAVVDQLKLENSLRWSFFTLIYNRSSNIWIISYILHINPWYISQKRFITSGFLSYSVHILLLLVIGRYGDSYLSCKPMLSEKGPFVLSVVRQRKEYAWTLLVCSFCRDLVIVYHTVISLNLLGKLIGMCTFGLCLTESILKDL